MSAFLPTPAKFIRGRGDLFLLHGRLHLRFRFLVHPPFSESLVIRRSEDSTTRSRLQTISLPTSPHDALRYQVRRLGATNY